MIQQEEEDAKYKTIQRYLSLALRDDANPSRGDTNPLLRRSRLTDLNPLL